MNGGLDDSRKLLFRRALQWARVEGLHTEVMPDHAVFDADGVALVDGYRLMPNRWSDLAFGAFVSITAATLAWMMEPRFGAGGVVAVVAVALAVGGLLAGGAAFVAWRRARVPMTLCVVAQGAPVRTQALQDLLARPTVAGATAETWVIADRGYSAKALRHASARDNLQCYVPRGPGFVRAVGTVPGISQTAHAQAA